MHAAQRARPFFGIAGDGRPGHFARMRNFGLIGLGAIGTAIVGGWREHLAHEHLLAAVLVRPMHIEHARAHLGPETLVTSDISAFLARWPSTVVEAAGHDAVADYGEAILEAGVDLHVLSVGALACEDVRSRLIAATQRGGGRIVVPSGALAGFDGLASLGVAGLRSVKYTSIKPVEAWRRTMADDGGRLENLTSPLVVFSGSAREAAIAFPKNTNLAAAIALRGLGFDRTQVELIADPFAKVNQGRIEAESDAGSLDVTLSGAAFADNPRSSRVTALSAIAALKGVSAPIVFA